MGCALVFIIAVYLLLTFVAAWILSEGFRIDFSISALFLLALMWPVLLLIIAISVYEEWRMRRRRDFNGN